MRCHVLVGRRSPWYGAKFLDVRAAEILKPTGTYCSTSRNLLIVDHFAKVGFTKVREEESGSAHREFVVEGAHLESVPVKVLKLDVDGALG